jgi:hypothetical protein
MGFQIEDGVGTGSRARVNEENQMLVEAEVHELQHHISISHGQVYQVLGTHTLSTSGSHTILHVTNNDSERFIVISYMRVQFPGGDGTVDADTYFQCGFNTVYSSSGVESTPVNMNGTSGNIALVSAYADNPEVTGNLDVFDVWYPDKSQEVFEKNGSIIMGLGDTIEWRLVTDQSSGLAYARISMMMLNKNSL